MDSCGCNLENLSESEATIITNTVPNSDPAVLLKAPQHQQQQQQTTDQQQSSPTTGATEEEEMIKHYQSIQTSSDRAGGSYSSFQGNPYEEKQLIKGVNKLFGRKSEARKLRRAYRRLVETQHAQAVLVHGESGCGKTALVVETLRSLVLEHTQGFFVTGKYLQNAAAVQEPYSAIMAAFAELCDLIVRADDFDRERRRKIALALETDAKLLAKVIPNLSSLIGDRSRSSSRGCGRGDEIEVSFPKFKAACKAFIHAVASPTHPIVVFLDDVQWADEGSTQLIQMFLHDAELNNVMFVVAYRDEEFEFNMETILESVRATIKLTNLDEEAVYQMVASIMGSTASAETRQLSDVVAKQTCGNPLHIKTYMAAIQQKNGLVEYDNEEANWRFDVDEILRDVMVQESLADLLMRKMEGVSDATKVTLKIASLLGYAFRAPILQRVACIALKEKDCNFCSNVSLTFSSDTFQNVVLSSLSKGIEEGFIEQTENGGYTFTHDKLQSSFQVLVLPDLKESRIRQLIGEAFLSQGNNDQKSNMYKAAGHLNCATELLVNRRQRARLARINLASARYCEEISAFAEAASMLQFGINTLGQKERWCHQNFTLTFTMMEALAKDQLIVGDFEGCRETTNEALLQSKSAEAKINLQLISVELCLATNEIGDALAEAKAALLSLGVALPQKANKMNVIAKLFKVKWMLSCKTDAFILSIQPAQDARVANVVRLLMQVCASCLVKGEADTGIFSALLAVELTLKKGISPHCPGAFVMYGVAELSLGNIDRAYRFGKLAIAILNGMKSKEASCHIVGTAVTMLTFRKEPFHELSGHLYQVSNQGFHLGDIIYATYCVSQSFFMLIHLGAPLSSLESAMRASYGRVAELGQDGQLLWLQPGLQYVLNMQSDACRWDEIAILSGEIMDEKEYFREASTTSHAVLVMVALVWKVRLAVDFGDFHAATAIFESCKSFSADVLRLSHVAPPFYWDQARAHYGLFEQSGQRSHLKKARAYTRILKRMTGNGCQNAPPLLAFLVAQETALKKRSSDFTAVRSAYDAGIDKLSEGMNFKNLEGLLNERAGFDFAKRGHFTAASVYFNRALHIYKHEWGTVAKYNHLKHKSALALRDHNKKTIRDGTAAGNSLVTKCVSEHENTGSTNDGFTSSMALQSRSSVYIN